ncbi:uncharacterized protein METZ01_LOCUS359694, partial [marine metagenome]
VIVFMLDDLPPERDYDYAAERMPVRNLPAPRHVYRYEPSGATCGKLNRGSVKIAYNFVSVVRNWDCVHSFHSLSISAQTRGERSPSMPRFATNPR